MHNPRAQENSGRLSWKMELTSGLGSAKQANGKVFNMSRPLG